MVSILLSGAGGKMGQVITRSVSERDDCRIAAGIDIHSIDCGYPVFSSPEQCDVACDVIIDFSHPSVTNSLLDYAVKHKIPAVIAPQDFLLNRWKQSMRLQKPSLSFSLPTCRWVYPS